MRSQAIDKALGVLFIDFCAAPGVPRTSEAKKWATHAQATQLSSQHGAVGGGVTREQRQANLGWILLG